MLTTTDSGEAEAPPILQAIHKVHHPEHGLLTITTIGATRPETVTLITDVPIPIRHQEAIHHLMVAAEVLAQVHHPVDRAAEPETDL